MAAQNRRFRPAVILPVGDGSKVKAVADAIAQKFNLVPKDIGTVMITGAQGQEQTVVLLKAGNGIFLGEWNDIFAPENAAKFVIDVHGQRYDTRDGLTNATYAAFIAD